MAACTRDKWIVSYMCSVILFRRTTFLPSNTLIIEVYITREVPGIYNGIVNEVYWGGLEFEILYICNAAIAALFRLNLGYSGLNFLSFRTVVRLDGNS